MQMCVSSGDGVLNRVKVRLLFHFIFNLSVAIVT